MDAHAPTESPAEPATLAFPRPPEIVELAQALIHTRQTLLPKRLFDPGPNEFQTRQILAAAAHAPDHHELTPWRFVVVPAAARAPAQKRTVRVPGSPGLTPTRIASVIDATTYP